jgi:PAS domain S-box-containing protein
MQCPGPEGHVFGSAAAVLLSLDPLTWSALHLIARVPLWQAVLAVCGGLLGTALAAVRFRRAAAPGGAPLLRRPARGTEVLAGVLAASGEALIAVDAAGAVTHWSPAAARLFGWNPEEAVGRPLPVVLDGGEGQVPLAGVLRDRGGWAGPDVRCLRRDGAPVTLRLQTARAGGGFVLAFAESAPSANNAVRGDRRASDPPALPADRLRALEDAERRAELLERMVALGRALRHPNRPAATARTIGEGARGLGADRAAVYLRQPDGTLSCAWAENLSSGYVAQVLRWARELAGGRVMDGARPDLLELSGRGIDASGPVLYADVDALPPAVAIPRITQAEGYRALGNWPLVYDGAVLGLLSCYYDAPRTWSAGEEEVLRTFAEDAAIALHNAAVLDAQQQRAADLEVLFDLTRRLRVARSPEEIYPILLNHARELLRADAGVLALLAAERAEFDWVAASGIPSELRAAAFPVAGSPFGQVAATGATYQTSNFGAQPLPVWLAAFRAIGPAVAVPLRSDEETIGVCCLGRTHRSDAEPFGDAEVRLFEAIADIGGTAIRRARLIASLEQSYMQMVLSLARTMDARDSYTSGHSERISEWADAVACALGCGDAERQDIRWGALLHDIGKIGVPDSILRKPGRLTEAEWAIMRRHPEIGESILASTDRMRGVAGLVRHHQEKWDGSGYPDGLKGEEIPLGARILAVCDAYSAITDDRPYKKARSREDALAELRRCAGAQFDPRVVEAFCRLQSEIQSQHPQEREHAGRAP